MMNASVLVTLLGVVAATTGTNLCAGQTQVSDWQATSDNTGIYVDVDTSGCGLTQAHPAYITNVHGTNFHWTNTGTSAIYSATSTGFRLYMSNCDTNWLDTAGFNSGAAVASECLSRAASYQWVVNWVADKSGLQSGCSSSGAWTSASDDSTSFCPSTHPFAYRPSQGFDYCCATGAPDPRDGGGAKEHCLNNQFAQCSSPPCADHMFSTGMRTAVSTASAGFTSTPTYVTSIHGTAGHTLIRGAHSIYSPTVTGFTTYLYGSNDVAAAQANNWQICWIASDDSNFENQSGPWTNYGIGGDSPGAYSDTSTQGITTYDGYTNVYVTSLQGSEYHSDMYGASSSYPVTGTQSIRTYIHDATQSKGATGTFFNTAGHKANLLVGYIPPAKNFSFELQVAGGTAQEVQNTVSTYKQALATTLGVDISAITITVVTETSRRLVEGTSVLTLLVTISTTTPASVQTAVTTPTFAATVSTELESAGITASLAANLTPTCSVTCTFSTTLQVTHDTTSLHTHHKCYVGWSDMCICECCDSTQSDCDDSTNFTV